MSKHHIHDKEIDFKDDVETRSARKYLEYHLSSEGFKYLLEKAERHDRANFTDLDEWKYKLLYEEGKEEGKKEFSVRRRE